MEVVRWGSILVFAGEYSRVASELIVTFRIVVVSVVATKRYLSVCDGVYG